MVKQFMRRHSLADPMYAGLPDMPAHARPKLQLVGKAIQPDENEILRKSARPQCAPASCRTPRPRNRRMTPGETA